MAETLSWWLVVAVMGLVAFPLVYLFFPRFPDRGYAFSKAFGILGIGYVFWVLCSAWVIPNTAGGIIWVLGGFAVASGIIAWRRRDELRRFFERNWPIVVAVEVLFFLAFIFAAFLRSYVPEIAGTEKPMDFAFLNASTNTEHFPPNDPWLSGHSISYYYGGYFLVAMIGKLASVPTEIGYNLGLAMTAALAAVGAFGIILNLILMHRGKGNPQPEHQKPANFIRPALFGLGGAILLVVMGNLEGMLEFLAAHKFGGVDFWNWIDIKELKAAAEPSDKWYPVGHWWWWRAARVVSPNAPEMITEFPFFSFLLGDLHPHVTALPFALLGIAAGIRLLQEERTLNLSFWSDRLLLLAALAVLVGGLSFLNTWDMPTFFVLLVVAAFIRNFLATRRWDRTLITDTLGFAAPLALVSVLAYLPYHKGFIPQLGFSSQAEGIAPVDGAGTKPLHALVIWGPMAVLVVPFAIQRLLTSSKATLRQPRYWLALVPGLTVIVVWFLWVLAKGKLGDAISDRSGAWITALALLLLLSLLLLALWRELESESHEQRHLAVITSLLVSALAVLLLLGAEFFFVKDVFGNRMNTVFKLYYQAWLLLAIGGGFALYYLASRWLPRLDVNWGWRAGWTTGAVVVLGAAMLYPLGATFDRTQDFDAETGLNGLAWAKDSYADFGAAEWLKEHAKPDDIIVETVGSEETGTEWGMTGRIASWTGLSTVLGWPGHERQWRGSYEALGERQPDVDLLYGTDDPAIAAQVIQKYGIDYVYVGSIERQVYPAAGLDKFETMLQRVYPQDAEPGQAAVYKVAGPGVFADSP